MPKHHHGIDAWCVLVVAIDAFRRRSEFEGVSGLQLVHDFSLDEGKTRTSRIKAYAVAGKITDAAAGNSI